MAASSRFASVIRVMAVISALLLGGAYIIYRGGGERFMSSSKSARVRPMQVEQAEETPALPSEPPAPAAAPAQKAKAAPEKLFISGSKSGAVVKPADVEMTLEAPAAAAPTGPPGVKLAPEKVFISGSKSAGIVKPSDVEFTLKAPSTQPAGKP
jgi:hypothetical protein